MTEAIVITGAAGGIGRALFAAVADAGYVPIAIDRQVPDGAIGHWLAFDLARLADGEAAIAELRAGIDALLDADPSLQIAGLVNNAALQVVGDASTIDAKLLRLSLDVNAIAPFLLARMLRPDLESTHGCIVNIGSIHSHLTKSGFAAYSISKSALAGVTRALAVEWGNSIRVAGIEPAAIATPMLEAGFSGNAAARVGLDRAHPAGTVGEAAQIGHWLLAILADRHAFANGTIIRIDGGISSRLHDPA